MMGRVTSRIVIFLLLILASSEVAFAQVDPGVVFGSFLRQGRFGQNSRFPANPASLSSISETPSFDCTNASNSVAKILCSGQEGAWADWELNSALWAKSGSNDETQEKAFIREQQAWRETSPNICSLSPEMIGYSQQQYRCVLNEFHIRSVAIRSTLAGDALAESLLIPEQHAKIQGGLIVRGYLQTHADGQFGPLTRAAIRRYQEATGRQQTGFLAEIDRTFFLGNSQREVFSNIAPPAQTTPAFLDPSKSVLPNPSEHISTTQRGGESKSPSIAPPRSQMSEAPPPRAGRAISPQEATQNSPPADSNIQRLSPESVLTEPRVEDPPSLRGDYFSGLALILVLVTVFWSRSRKFKGVSDFELMSDEQRHLETNEAALYAAAKRKRSIRAEGQHLKRNLDQTYHRGSKLGQKLNEELDELNPRIRSLLRSVLTIGLLPTQRLHDWSVVRASFLSLIVVAGLYVLTPLSSTRSGSFHLGPLIVACIILYLVGRRFLRPIIIARVSGIHEFQEKWSRYRNIHLDDDEIELDLSFEGDEDFQQQGSHFESNQEHHQTNDSTNKPKAPTSWHDVLCVSALAGASEIKSARNKKAKEFHSDRLKAVEGLSPEFAKFADEKMAEINQAYDEAMASLKRRA